MSDGKPTRRTVLGVLAGTAVVASAGTSRAAAPPAHPVRYGMVIDLDRCVRCGNCVVACEVENNVAPQGERSEARARPIHWMDFLLVDEPDFALGTGTLPIPCMHCEDSPCTKACPVGATYATPEGIVAQIWERCIGCRACMVACPYSRRYYNFTAPDWSGDKVLAINPDVAVRPMGVVEKCTFCHHRIRTAKEQALLEGEPVTDATLARLPACAAACPSEAIAFGDLNDGLSLVSQLSRSPRAVRLLEYLGTGPKVIFLRGKR